MGLKEENCWNQERKFKELEKKTEKKNQPEKNKNKI